jgi:phosphate transport system permease protein
VATATEPTPAVRVTTPPRRLGQKVREWLIEKALLLCGLFSILVTLTIAGVVFYGSLEFFLLDNGQRMSAAAIRDRAVYFFTGTEWTAGFATPRYGILPLLMGTLSVAVIASFIALPIGLATAVYLSEYATPRTRTFAKPTLELLAGIPTVVYGFFAITFVTPHLLVPLFGRFGIAIGDPNNQLSAGIVVGIMIIPTVASLSEDALRSVPRTLRDGAYALGATKYETSVKVVVPAALSGITASFLLAISRAIGETMAVSLAAGDTPRIFSITEAHNYITQGLATMTSFIVRIAKGDVQHGSTDFNSLFAVGGLLFCMTLFMNIIAQKVMKRYRMVYQ